MVVQKYRSIERIVDNIGNKRGRQAHKYASFRQHMHITDKRHDIARIPSSWIRVAIGQELSFSMTFPWLSMTTNHDFPWPLTSYRHLFSPSRAYFQEVIKDSHSDVASVVPKWWCLIYSVIPFWSPSLRMTLKQKTKNPFIIWSRVVSITGFWTAITELKHYSMTSSWSPS